MCIIIKVLTTNGNIKMASSKTYLDFILDQLSDDDCIYAERFLRIAV